MIDAILLWFGYIPIEHAAKQGLSIYDEAYQIGFKDGWDAHIESLKEIST